MGSREQLVGRFLARFGGSVPATEALEAALVDLTRRASEAWPGGRMPLEELVEAVAARLDPDGDAIAALVEMRAGDMYIAQACAAGYDDALAMFERTYMPVVVTKVRGMRGAAHDAAEVAQQIRERLLVGDGDRGPRIADYAGRGELRRWLRATATRSYLNLRRKNKREVAIGDESVLDAMVEGAADPELANMKKKYAAEFKAAFEDALGTLSARQRTLLRYQHVDGLTVDKIAAIYKVHRATLHRWLASARETLAAATERNMRRALSISDSEFQSMRRMVQSQLDLSISRVLAVEPE